MYIYIMYNLAHSCKCNFGNNIINMLNVKIRVQ